MAESRPTETVHETLTVEQFGDGKRNGDDKNTIKHQTFFSPQERQVIRLKLKKPKPDKKVSWRSDTVDNEHLNKKKSKCCCIYKKPQKFGESSSESDDDDDECQHCRGHVELKKKQVPASSGTEGSDQKS
ncbi:uncharacterized protein LOC143224182 isoform X2 [Tachypleus tridentatus]|uniref:uncharacterized protein LOC143224182 isoform X2 n=1 Tax=Tachypleus tridentatus TaxID=6853 RepID=UPI003FCFF8BC